MFARLASTFVTFVACATAANAALNFGGGKWIWGSDAVAGNFVTHPVETRGFRKDINMGLKTPTFLEAIMIGDDEFTFYVNGAQVGSGKWATPEYFCVPVSSSSNYYLYNKLVLAVYGANTLANTPAALLGTILVHYSDGSSDRFVTDKSWLSSANPAPSGFQAPNFNDEYWTPAVEQSAYEDSYDQFIPVPPAKQVCNAA